MSDNTADANNAAEEIPVSVTEAEPAVASSNEEKMDYVAIVQKAKRDICCGSYLEAVNAMGSACKAMEEEFGQMSYKMAEAYYVYGNALLELSRVESNILGNALDGVPVEEGGEGAEEEPAADEGQDDDGEAKDDEEAENISEKIIDAMCEDRMEAQAAEDPASTNEVEPTKETPSAEEPMATEDAKPAAEAEPGATEVAKTAESPVETAEKEDEAAKEEETEQAEDDAEGSEDADGEGNEDVSNLQLAWETLELARLINERHFAELPTEASNDERRNVLLDWSDCVYLLAQVSMELGRWDQALEDAMSVVSLRKQAFTYPPETETLAKSIFQTRTLGESHYLVGTVCTGKGDHEQAVQEIQLCNEMLQNCVNIIKSRMQDDSENTEEQRGYLEKQLKDIETLLPELTERIQELQSEQRDLDDVRKEMKQAMSTFVAAAESALASVEQPATDDITHLIRKKRPTTDVAGAENEALAEQKPSNGNGHEEVANGHPDGDKEEAKVEPPLKKARVEEVQEDGVGAEMA